MEYQVRDINRTLSFTGTLLAESSSRTVGKPRWTDLRLYRTDNGTYILEKVGASRLMHMPGCRKSMGDLPRFQDLYPGADPDDPEFAYDDCVPDPYDFTALRIEQDRHWAQITERPEAIVKAVMRYKGGVTKMPYTSAVLLAKAAEVDDGIAEVYDEAWID